MRVSVLSDIHGNWFALQSVLKDAAQEGVTEVWFLGDLVGYGPHSLRCHSELSSLEEEQDVSLTAVAGNHDLGLLGKIPLTRFRSDAEWVLRQIGVLASLEHKEGELNKMREFLATLPTFRESPQAGVWLMHGWVTRNEQGEIDERSNVLGDNSYISRRDDIWKIDRSWKVLDSLAIDEIHRPDIILAGHTHQPSLWRRSEGKTWHPSLPPGRELQPPEGWMDGCPKCGREGPCRSGRRWAKSITLPNEPVLINPGSVGKPRDGCPAAAYVILDFEEHRTQVTFRRVGYDIQATRNSLARLAKQEDGSRDLRAMETHVAKLRAELMIGG